MIERTIYLDGNPVAYLKSQTLSDGSKVYDIEIITTVHCSDRDSAETAMQELANSLKTDTAGKVELL